MFDRLFNQIVQALIFTATLIAIPYVFLAIFLIIGNLPAVLAGFHTLMITQPIFATFVGFVELVFIVYYFKNRKPKDQPIVNRNLVPFPDKKKN